MEPRSSCNILLKSKGKTLQVHVILSAWELQLWKPPAVICFSCSYGACDKYGPGASGDNKLHQAGWASVKCCEEDGGTRQQPGHHFQRETPRQSHGALLTRVRSRARPPQQETQSRSSPCFIGLCLSQIYLWMFSCSEGLNKAMMTIWNLYQSANPIL